MKKNTRESILARINTSAGPDACHLWTDPIHSTGYAYVSWDGKPEKVCNLVWEWQNGPVPVGRELDHRCHNPEICQGGPTCPHRKCCNPRHLMAVPPGENSGKGRSVAHNRGGSGGSLKQVRPGVWRSRVVVGYIDGDTTRPQQHAETYGTNAAPVTQRQAERLHAKHVAQAADDQLSTSVDTYGGYLSRWLDDRTPTWKASTERRNRSIVRQIPDSLSAIKLRDLKRGDIQRYIDTLPPAGARRVHAVLSGALKDAVAGEKEGLARNPAEGIRLPRTNVPEASPPDDAGLRLILGSARLKGELWGDFFTFSAYTGLRRGEVCALRWADLDGLESVTVRHNVETLTKGTNGATWALTDTKSHQTRTVPLAQPARRAIARRRELFTPNLPDPEAFVFFAKDSSMPLHPDHVSKVFTAAAKTAGVFVTLKDFRSYCATVLADSAGLKTAQHFLGHRDATTTARHYAGRSADAVARGLDALNAADQDTPELDEGAA